MPDTSYLFVFGRTPALSMIELQSFFPESTFVSDAVAAVRMPASIDPNTYMQMLGGTVKIASVSGTVQAPDESLASFLPQLPSLTFGISTYPEGFTIPNALLSSVKSLLEARGKKVRYIVPQHSSALTSVQIVTQHASELILVKTEDGILVGNTLAVQSADEWSTRDYGRPFADAKRGMLPVKVARMLVNCARRAGQSEKPMRLLDPFCGMGTILTEAVQCGFQVDGTDISAEAVEKTQKNLEWVKQQSLASVGAIGVIKQYDAAHVSELFGPSTFDVIVTEPYLGSPAFARARQPDIQTVKNQIKGLEKLYIGCLREWNKILKESGLVIIALPSIDISGRTYFVKKVIDMCENLGYTIEVGPIEYSRPQAVVKRNFYLLRKKSIKTK